MLNEAILYSTILFFTIYLKAQNIDFYLTLLEKGEIDEVRNNLTELFERYPNNAGVYFLDALTSDNGDTSVFKYEKIINYNNTPLTLYKLLWIQLPLKF